MATYLIAGYGSIGAFFIRTVMREFNKIDGKYNGNLNLNGQFGSFVFIVSIAVLGSITFWPAIGMKLIGTRAHNNKVRFQDIYNKLAGDKEAIAYEKDKKIRKLESSIVKLEYEAAMRDREFESSITAAN